MHKWLAWAIALGVSERWIHSFEGLAVSEPAWYTARGGFNLGSFDRSLGRFSAVEVVTALGAAAASPAALPVGVWVEEGAARFKYRAAENFLQEPAGFW